MEWVLFFVLTITNGEFKSYSVTALPGYVSLSDCETAGYSLVRKVINSNGEKPVNYVCVERKRLGK